MSDKKTWEDLHKDYSKRDWITKPNIFAQEVVKYFPKNSYILCLGDGQGQDGRFFASKKYQVVSTDISQTALEENKKAQQAAKLTNLQVESLDLRKKFSYQDNTFDVVYAHLSLHYFTEKITLEVFQKSIRS